MEPAPSIVAMRDQDWASLTSSIESERCILMLGPDAFLAEFEGEIVSAAVGMARFAKKRLGDKFAYLDPSKPWSVAQAVVVQEDANTLRAWANEFYGKYHTDSKPLRKLASLPFRLIINTSAGFDAERAFTTEKSDTHVGYYDRTAPARTDLPDPTRDSPVLYGLYGSLHRPSSMILSESDRLDFLISIITQDPPLPPKLTSAFCDPQQSFLFLGFNLKQWQLRMLMHVVLRKAQRENKSFALELEREGVDEDTKLFYTTGHKVRFVDMDLHTFIDQLRVRVREPSVLGGHDVSIPAPDAPTVFLCHADEDAKFANELASRLQENAIKVWLDKDRLRGGHRWDEVIERVLQNDVQYVVVLQSASLKSKDVGYVNKEIYLARQRQKKYRSPRVFLIPALIDSSDSMLAELEELQSIDLSNGEGVNDLVKAIRRDLDAVNRTR